MEALAKREQKMWEKSRQKRVNGWRAWDARGGGKHAKMPKVQISHHRCVRAMRLA